MGTNLYAEDPVNEGLENLEKTNEELPKSEEDSSSAIDTTEDE
jgi:hypothetical protein